MGLFWFVIFGFAILIGLAVALVLLAWLAIGISLLLGQFENKRAMVAQARFDRFKADLQERFAQGCYSVSEWRDLLPECVRMDMYYRKARGFLFHVDSCEYLVRRQFNWHKSSSF